MSAPPRWLFNQSGVIPYIKTNGDIKIVLITNIKFNRWIIPKGVIELDLTPQASAVHEAYEEAGIEGIIEEDEFGSYQYVKWSDVCTVKVYLFEVTKLLKNWPEKEKRNRRIFSIEEAILKIEEEGLKKLIESAFNTLNNQM